MGAEVRAVEAGQKTLKEAVNEALRDWVTNVRNTHYVLGTACGPIRIRRWCVIFIVSSGSKPRSRFSREGRLPDELLRVSAAAVMRLDSFF